MKRSCILLTLFSLASSNLTFLATAAPDPKGQESNAKPVANNKSETAHALSKEKKDEPKLPDFAVVPTSKTLPQGIFKIDFPVAYSFGDFGYDKNYSRKKNGFSFERVMSATILQYGVTNHVSIGVALPYTIHNGLEMHGNRFRKSDFFARYLNKAISDLEKNAPSILCSGNSCSRENILNGATANTEVKIFIPTGEEGTIEAGQPILTSLENIIATAAAPTDGKDDIGDVQFGFLWNMLAPAEEDTLFSTSLPVYVSAGLALRAPTGKFNVPAAMRQTGGDGTLSTGGGTFDGILRTNVDYAFHPASLLSWQNQLEYSFTNADLFRSSMLDPSEFNTADPSVGNANQGYADGVNNTLKFSREGVRIYGMLQYALGLGMFSNALKIWGLYSQFKYNVAAKALLNGKTIYALGDQFYLNDGSVHPNDGREQFYSAVAGFKVNGLPMRIPLELSTEFEYPFLGANRLVSPMNFMTTLSVYF